MFIWTDGCKVINTIVKLYSHSCTRGESCVRGGAPSTYDPTYDRMIARKVAPQSQMIDGPLAQHVAFRKGQQQQQQLAIATI